MNGNNYKLAKVVNRERLMSDIAIMSLTEFMDLYDCSEMEYWEIFRRFRTAELIVCLQECIRDMVAFKNSLSDDLYLSAVSRLKKRMVTLFMLDMGYDEDMCIYFNDNGIC